MIDRARVRDIYQTYTTPRRYHKCYNNFMSIERQSIKRVYKKITPRTVANHTAQAVLSGNHTQAVREIEPEYKAPEQRAMRIVTKNKDQSVVQYIENSLEQIGTEAIDRVGELVHSEDERIATKNAHFVIEHIRGKAVQRSVSLTGKLNIQSVLD